MRPVSSMSLGNLSGLQRRVRAKFYPISLLLVIWYLYSVEWSTLHAWYRLEIIKQYSSLPKMQREDEGTQKPLAHPSSWALAKWPSALGSVLCEREYLQAQYLPGNSFSTFPEAATHNLRRKTHSSDCSYGYFLWLTCGSFRKLLWLREVAEGGWQLTAGLSAWAPWPNQWYFLERGLVFSWASLLILFRNFP